MVFAQCVCEVELVNTVVGIDCEVLNEAQELFQKNGDRKGEGSAARRFVMKILLHTPISSCKFEACSYVFSRLSYGHLRTCPCVHWMVLHVPKSYIYLPTIFLHLFRRIRPASSPRSVDVCNIS